MPITIAKDAGAGGGSDTTITFNNVQNVTIRASTPVDVIDFLGGNEDDAIPIKIFGPKMVIDFDWTLLNETSSVVTGAGGTVDSPAEQQIYLMDHLLSKGSSSHDDTYTLTIDYGGSVTFARTGQVTDITCTISDPFLLTLTGHITFAVADTP